MSDDTSTRAEIERLQERVAELEEHLIGAVALVAQSTASTIALSVTIDHLRAELDRSEKGLAEARAEADQLRKQVAELKAHPLHLAVYVNRSELAEDQRGALRDALKRALCAGGVVHTREILDAISEETLDKRSASWRVWLDDERDAPPEWVRVRTSAEAIALLGTGRVAEISLDHDLGDDAVGTGYDVLLYLEDAVQRGRIYAPRIHVHTANPAARQRMVAAVAAIERIARERQEQGRSDGGER